ncbi:MAG: aconitate hydratase AcnA [Deltaproteobacteria bacterium]|nr:aconitate hydratase AcnA [Deltaproteobacteria bacterium]
MSKNSFNTRKELETAAGVVTYYSLPQLAADGVADVHRLPFSIKVLLESLLRNEDGHQVTTDDVQKLCDYNPAAPTIVEIPFKPARVILQDFTGVPAVVDLAAMRSAMGRLGGNPQLINPQIPVDLVIDHSVQVDVSSSADALQKNAEFEFRRNRERYMFLRWGAQAFDNFGVIPPASGIVHQVNVEYLAKGVQSNTFNGQQVLYPDSLVGTDSHTTMINGLGVVGWGVGGIEAEAVMLGQPIYMLAPEVIGFELTGKLPEGATATDLVLVVTQMLREHGVVGKFVEFYGKGLSHLSLADRTTLANMGPEYGATMGFFPVDTETIRYLRASGRDEQLVDTVERYFKAQGLFRHDETPAPEFAATVKLDMASVEPALAGPKRPQDRIRLADMKKSWQADLRKPASERGFALSQDQLDASAPVTLGEKEETLQHGSLVIAAITSCTNTSNPSVMIAAGLVAKKAVERGLSVNSHVKASLAPGSRVVTEYLDRTGLTPYLDQLGFQTVGYGCTTCIGNSGPLAEPVVNAIKEANLVVTSVLSGNRNFEGRVNPHTKGNYLASPPLVVAYALAGTVDIDLTKDPMGQDKEGEDVFMKDLWPSNAEIAEHLGHAENPEVFKKGYDGVENANEMWNAIPVSGGALYDWDEGSTYIQEPPFFVGMSLDVRPIQPITGARVLLKLADSITTDHISPAGVIPAGAAEEYLLKHGVEREDFNSFGSRRGNDRVMTRGTFANIRLKNQMAPGTEGSFTTHVPTGEVMSVYDAAQRYKESKTPTIVLAGNDYGMGSSRDWAAKGTFLLGVGAVIAQSFERIHRSNLVGMGVLPLQFVEGANPESLGLTGKETFTIHVDDTLEARQQVQVDYETPEGKTGSFMTDCRIDTSIEIDYYRNGGILHTVLRRLAAQSE